MSATSPAPDGTHDAEKLERRWAVVAVCIVCMMIVLAAFAGIHELAMPQARVETVNFRTLHLAGEFIESNLGTAVDPDGSITVRAVGQQYSFSPPCIVVPASTPVTFRATSADVVHGLLVEGTNINMMLVPGFVSVTQATFDKLGDHLMPCQEFCGAGHQGMWGKIRVLSQDDFRKLAADKPRVSCAP